MSEEQQLIDLAISNFLKTNDASARQYQIHRRNALEISQLVQREMAASGEVSAATKARLQQIQYDNMKMNVQYKAHVERLQRNMGMFEQSGEIPGLDEQMQEICRKNDAISKEVDKMAVSHKPVVEKLSRLVRNFETSVSIKSSRANRTKTVAEKGETSGECGVLLKYEASVFSRSELEGLFGNVTKRLAKLKTVDEIGNDGIEERGRDEADLKRDDLERDDLKMNDLKRDDLEMDNSKMDNSKMDDSKMDQSSTNESIKTQSIDVAKHLGELLQNSRAYTRLEDGSYKYDISKSSSVDIGNVSMSLEEYAKAIDLLVRDIQDLVVRGTEAKERWVLNARKIEMMQSLLDDAMEID